MRQLMVKNFFITGLPRSRTAWLANFMTFGGSECLHDGTAQFETRAVYAAYLRDAPCAYAGDSNSGLLLRPDVLLRDFPDSPLVLIERPLEEVSVSLALAFGITEIGHLENLQGTLDLLKGRANTLCVRFDDLDDRETLQAIWTHCTPSLPFDHARAERLNGFRVTIHQEKYLSSIASMLGENARHWAINPDGGASCH